jgi:predicted RNase H-like HicB family nuclease
MELPVTIEVWQKGNYYVAKCPELDFISQGCTLEEAKRHLFEVIDVQFEEMTAMGTLDEYLAECGYLRGDATFVPQVEMISLEQHAIQVA